MTDTEMWKEWKKMKQTAATQRRENAPELLQKAGIPFTTHNNGAHLILDTYLGFVDFWPGTTKWKTRTFPAHEGFGITRLLDLIHPDFC